MIQSIAAKNNEMSIEISAVGDIVLSGALQQASGEATIYEHLRRTDSCFANLEMPFTTSNTPAEKLIALKCDPVYASIIPQLGIDVVTLANNHGMDYGIDGLHETTDALNSVNVAHVGCGVNVSESFKAVFIEKKGYRVAYIGMATTLPNGSGAGPKRPGLAGVRVFTKYIVDTVTLDETPGMAPFVETETYKPDEQVLLAAIGEAKVRADIVLVAIHWGIPYGWVPLNSSELATYQQPLAHAMIDAGASAIFGHHPHVVQGVEFYKNVPIFYSLGNFIFSNNIVTPTSGWRNYPPYNWKSLQQSLSNIGSMAKLSWTDGKLSKCSMVAITLNDNGEPIEATLEDGKIFLSRLQSLSEEHGTAISRANARSGFEVIVSAV